MSSFEERRSRSVEAVIRFQVAEASQARFHERVDALLGEARKHAAMAETSIRVLQAVVGSAPFEWELRVTVPNLQALGAVLDHWSSPPDLRPAEELRPGESILGALSRIEGARILDAGIPVYRVWT